MLTDDNRAALTGLEIFWQQQVAPGKNVGENVQYDFVPGPFWAIIDFARARIKGGKWDWHLTDNVMPEIRSEGRASGLPVLRRIGLDAAPEVIDPILIGLAQQALGELVQLLELLVLARSDGVGQESTIRIMRS